MVGAWQVFLPQAGAEPWMNTFFLLAEYVILLVKHTCSHVTKSQSAFDAKYTRPAVLCVGVHRMVRFLFYTCETANLVFLCTSQKMCTM